MKFPLLCLLTALPCEARVFIDRYRLALIRRQPFSIYLSEKNHIALVVCGIGRVRASTAVSFIFGLWPNEYLQLVNCGIAGSANDAVGELFRIHKVSDVCGVENFYPYITRSTVTTRALISIDRAQSDYPTDELIDMEGIGFYSAARLLVNRENIHLLKIISDNAVTGINTISKTRVIELITDQFAAIDSVLQSLVATARTETELKREPAGFSALREQFHFSHYQQHELRELLRCFAINFPDRDVLMLCKNFRDAAMVLQCLRDDLQQVFGVIA